jgi:hypothetical protein
VKRTLLAVILGTLLLALPASAGDILGFTEEVSPQDETNATEPYIAIDRSDGTVWVAWQAAGTHVARSDDGGRTFVQTPIVDLFGRDLGDVDIAVGGPTPCATPTTNCLPGTRRVYVSSLERAPLILQTRLAYSDDRGAHWTVNSVAAIHPSLIDRPWLAVYPRATAVQDQVYIAYHDFTDSQIYVTASNDGGTTFGPSVVASAGPSVPTPTLGVPAPADSFCNTVPSGIEVDPRTGEVYVLWLTADPIANTTEGCNVSMIQNFHKLWVAHSPPAVGAGPATATVWDTHVVYDGAATENASDIFATLAVDDSGASGTPGNVYVAFADNKASPSAFDIWFTHSSDKGITWFPPVKVNSDKGTHFFPWIAAGSAGRVDFIWLNSPDYTPTDLEESPWYVTFAQTTNGTSASPKFNQTSASSSVMHVGGICTNGIFCTVNDGNRDLADSISIAIDRGGSAGLVWTDQGRVLHGPTHITYGCNTSQQTAYAGANQGLSCKGPAGP